MRYPKLCGLTLVIFLTSIISLHAARITYEKDVRPILKAHCFQCHGESEEVEGGLDLRLNRFIQSGGDSGPATIPGKSQESLLFQRIINGEMPPTDNSLSDQEIDTIDQWIQQGAIHLNDEPESLENSQYFTQEERRFWAFQPIVKPSLPELSDKIHTGSAVDRFLVDRLQSEGLASSPAAGKNTLIRRLTFDLLGIPPTPEQVDRFLANDAPDAYEQLVDELLASPHYGERWGRHWLDVAGYADSEGYSDSDARRPWAYYYRDYVIRAFNQNMPYDRFIVEQLAGDELVESAQNQLQPHEITLLQATGFLRMAPDGTGQAGVDAQVARNQVIADTLNIMTTSLLGLTVGCAQCHDHRYDPISQVDYYELRAILAPALDSQKWRTPVNRRISLYTDQDREKRAAIEKRAQAATAERQAQIDLHLDRTLTEELIRFSDALREPLRTAFKTDPKDRTEAQTLLLEEYPSIGKITSGSLYLYSRQRADRAAEIEKAILEKENLLIANIRQQQQEMIPADQRASITAILNIAEDERTSDQKKTLAAYPGILVDATTLKQFAPKRAATLAEYRVIAEVCRKTDSTKQLEALQKTIDEIRSEIPEEHFIRALTEPENHSPQTVLFLRGNHETPGSAVEPGELDILNEFVSVPIAPNQADRKTTRRRLSYAQHLTSGKHPLTARVLVNSVWMHHFGRGIVESTGDFGMLGQRPTHPQLLDWLAAEFMENGWDIKQLHKTIVTSHAYQQSSDRTAELDARDPDNRLLARQSLRRLESEAFRDSILMVSGLYNNKMHGPVVPVMEDGVGQIVIGIEDLDGERKPRAATGLHGEQHRRSVYVEVRRSRPLAVLATFDIATTTPNCTQRAASNVAPQSLLLMNSDFMIEYARSFADSAYRQAGPHLQDQLRFAWKTAFAEEASPENLQALTEFVAVQTKQISTDHPELTPAAIQIQALEIACQALLGSNQFLYID